MKKLPIVLFLVSLPVIVFCQDKAPSTETIRLNSIDGQIKVIENKIFDMETQQSKLYELFDMRDKLHQRLLSIQQLLVTIFGALIVIASVGIPLVIYFLGIRPARKSTKDLNQSFQTFLHDYQSSQMDQALNDLTNDDSSIVNFACNYIVNNRNHDFNEKQLLSVANHLQSDTQNESVTIRAVLTHILSRRKSRSADNFFRNNPKMFPSGAIKYYLNAGIQDYIPDIVRALKSFDGPNLYRNLLASAFGVADDAFTMLINRREIIQVLTEEQIKTVVEHAINHSSWAEYFDKEFYESRLHTKYLQIKNNDGPS